MRRCKNYSTSDHTCNARLDFYLTVSMSARGIYFATPTRLCVFRERLNFPKLHIIKEISHFKCQNIASVIAQTERAK